MADVLETSIDFLVSGDQSEGRPINNHRLPERFRELEQFENDDQETVVKLIDALIVKNRAEKILRLPQ